MILLDGKTIENSAMLQATNRKLQEFVLQKNVKKYGTSFTDEYMKNRSLPEKIVKH